jgi:broad specificity phosphatase PhoE
MLTLFYSPHMTSTDNEAKRASGHADVPLSEMGRQRAHELGQHYATETLDAIFCSDLQRALITSQIAFADRSLPIIPDARLREYDYGDMTQYPVAQVEDELPRRIREPFPNGESLLMVVQRMGAFLHYASPDDAARRAFLTQIELFLSLSTIAWASLEYRTLPIYKIGLVVTAPGMPGEAHINDSR